MSATHDRVAVSERREATDVGKPSVALRSPRRFPSIAPHAHRQPAPRHERAGL